MTAETRTLFSTAWGAGPTPPSPKTGADRRWPEASLEALLPVIGVLVRMIAIPPPECAVPAQ